MTRSPAVRLSGKRSALGLLCAWGGLAPSLFSTERAVYNSPKTASASMWWPTLLGRFLHAATDTGAHNSQGVRTSPRGRQAGAVHINQASASGHPASS